MPAVDTNLLVRPVVRDDPKHVRAAEAFVARGAWVSHRVLVEAVWVLSTVYSLGHQELVMAVEMLLQHECLTIQNPETVSAALEHYRQKPKLE